MERAETLELLVGRVGRPHGLEGDLFVDVLTDSPDRRFAPETVFHTSRGQLTVTASRWHGGRLLVTFDEVHDRTSAEAMRGVELRIAVAADERPDDPEEFYDHQLVGLRAVGPRGEPLGDVADVLHLPAQEVLVVRHEGRDVLVPFVADIVPVVDVAAGRLVIDDQPGLLQQPPAEPGLPDGTASDADESEPSAGAENGG